jgi:hypothetical protein
MGTSAGAGTLRSDTNGLLVFLAANLDFIYTPRVPGTVIARGGTQAMTPYRASHTLNNRAAPFRAKRPTPWLRCPLQCRRLVLTSGGLFAMY